MKKITYISLLFFFTSIFYLFMGFFGFQSVGASFFSDIVLNDGMDVSYSSYCSGNASPPVFSSDGKKIFLSCDNAMKVFSVSTPYTLEGFTYLSSISIGFTFKQFYFIDSRNVVGILFNGNYPDNFPLRKIFLSNPYDFSSFSITNYPFNASYFQFNKNGKLLYLQERGTYNSDLVISQYSLFNPYDLSTAFLDYKKTISAGGSVLGFSFSSDGNELSYYLYDTSNPRFCYRSLSNSYDLNTINNDLICKSNGTFGAYFLNSLSSDYSYIISSMRYATSPNNRNMRILYTGKSSSANSLKHEFCSLVDYNYKYPLMLFDTQTPLSNPISTYLFSTGSDQYTSQYKFGENIFEVNNIKINGTGSQTENLGLLFGTSSIQVETFGRITSPFQHSKYQGFGYYTDNINIGFVQVFGNYDNSTLNFYYIRGENGERLFKEENNGFGRMFYFSTPYNLSQYNIGETVYIDIPWANMSNTFTINDIRIGYYEDDFREVEHCVTYTVDDMTNITYDSTTDKYFYDDGTTKGEVIFDPGKGFVVIDDKNKIIKIIDSTKEHEIDGEEVDEQELNWIDGTDDKKLQDDYIENDLNVFLKQKTKYKKIDYDINSPIDMNQMLTSCSSDLQDIDIGPFNGLSNFGFGPSQIPLTDITLSFYPFNSLICPIKSVYFIYYDFTDKF